MTGGHTSYRLTGLRRDSASKKNLEGLERGMVRIKAKEKTKGHCSPQLFSKC